MIADIGISLIEDPREDLVLRWAGRFRIARQVDIPAGAALSNSPSGDPLASKAIDVFWKASSIS
jgi:hypothetical protein